MKFLTGRIVSGVLAFIFIFFAGWSFAITMVKMKYSIEIPSNVILGVFSLILGIIELCRLSKNT